jgi:hypothetical protein
LIDSDVVHHSSRRCVLGTPSYGFLQLGPWSEERVSAT